VNIGISRPASVADAFTSDVSDTESELALEDGSRVAVVGGGPAGSFFAYFLHKMAGAIGLDIGVDIYEPRSFHYCGPAGCNHCGGIVSESLVQILAAEGIKLPAEALQRGIESYLIHMDVGSVEIDSPAHEMRIASLFRGNGPRESTESSLESFDGHLQRMAVEQGAQVVRRLIQDVRWEQGRPVLRFADKPDRTYDLLAVASGVNSNFLARLEDLPQQFEPPQTTRTFICEFRLGAEGVQRYLGNAVHVFLLAIPRLEFAAMVPKGEFATVVMVGEDLDQALIHEFLGDPVVQAVFPVDTMPCVCSCNPLINMGARKRPYGDRIVLIGDSGVTRLYKDGIGSAYRTAKAAAETAAFKGISTRDFKEHFWPACRTIARDNAIGKVLFSTSDVLKHSRYLRGVVHRMIAGEQADRRRKPHMSKMMWNMFTGSAPYAEILQDAMHPGFFGHFLLSMTRRGSVNRQSKGVSAS